MLVAVAAALLLLVAPLLLALRGLLRPHRVPREAAQAPVRHSWQLSASSALLYAIAFNLTFFIQELFLVLPKALLSGVHPVLFHNNHTWVGENPLTSLFQGTGALAILASGVLCAWRLRRRPSRSRTVQLFLIWMAYNGLLQALPQVVVGAVYAGSDVGMAMDYLGWGEGTRNLAALLALAAIPPAALRMIRPLLALADSPAQVGDARTRSVFIFRTATLPALVAIALIIPFRIPREPLEVLAPPAVVTFIGVAWIQAGAWRVRGVRPMGATAVLSAWRPLGVLIGLLLLFQLLLRPGIRF
jgi:hypothetical protein